MSIKPISHAPTPPPFTDKLREFVTSVELLCSEPDVYTKLKKKMAEKGFIQTALADVTLCDDLKTSEYYYQSTSTRSDVMELAAGAAAAVATHYGVRVTDKTGLTLFLNLPSRR